MKLLVAQTKEKNSCFWKFENNLVEPLPLKRFDNHDLLQNTRVIKPGFLPYEIVDLVMKYLFKTYIETQNFEQAFELTMLNRDFARTIYFKIFGTRRTTNLEQMLYRLAKTFYLIEQIYDEYITLENSGSICKVGIKLTRNPWKMNARLYGPWDFSMNDFELEELDAEDLYPNVMHFKGETHGETVWIHGTEMNGVIDVAMFQNPVLNFILADYTDALIPCESVFAENLYFKSFSRLLKVCFGHQTGVYFMVKESIDRRNPFIHRSSTLMGL